MGKTKIKIIGIEEEPKVPKEPKELEKPKEKERLAQTIEGGLNSSSKEKLSEKAIKQVASAPKLRGKKYQEKAKLVDPKKSYPLEEAVKLAQEVSFTKFPATLEAHINTTAKNLRGLVSLPYFAGKKLTILAFGKDAENSGADIIGTEETIKDIEAGKINFDVLVTTPQWMPKLAKAAKILGPKGLMPNPKNGTITENLPKTVEELKGGKIEYKTDKDAAVIHLPVGKVDQSVEEVASNIKVLYNTIGKSKIKKITLSPTMGPGVKIDLGTI